MSDTPITDEAAYDYTTGERCLDGVVSANVVRKLERENAALRAAHDKVVIEFRKVETENAALRADKERLETALRFYADKSHLYETRGAFVENDEHRYCPDGAIVEHGAVARAAIDAARKEAQ